MNKKITNQEPAVDTKPPGTNDHMIDAGLIKQNNDSVKKKFIGLLLFAIFLLIGMAVFIALRGRGDGDMNDEISKEDIPSTFEEELRADVNEGEKTEASPINGLKYTPRRAEYWKKRRPMAVVIENHLESRPAYGVSQAEVVYEAVAEGGITRYVAVYLANQTQRLEPVRSAREYFLHWVSEYDALFVHFGGAETTSPKTDALGNIVKYNIADLDCIKGGNLCERDQDRFAPHNAMTATDYLWGISDIRKINKPTEFRSWKFKDEVIAEGALAPAQTITYNFWEDEDYKVTWKYNATTNSYLRFLGALIEPDIDANNNEQITAKNVVVMKVNQYEVQDNTEHQHLVFDTFGTGDGYAFIDGEKTDITWAKKDRTDRTIFSTLAGEEIEFNRGQIWISVIPTTSVVVVE